MLYDSVIEVAVKVMNLFPGIDDNRNVTGAVMHMSKLDTNSTVIKRAKISNLILSSGPHTGKDGKEALSSQL